MTDEILEYELIDIEFEPNYEDVVIPTLRVCEDGVDGREDKTSEVEFDGEGVPFGHSKAAIKIREKLIKDFYASWIADNPEKRVFNKNLNSNILVKFISINETYCKAARTYQSTKAVLQLTEILEQASLVEEEEVKNNKNQKTFSKMLIMRHGNVKLTVGLQKSTNEHVQYSITVPQKQQSHP